MSLSLRFFYILQAEYVASDTAEYVGHILWFKQLYGVGYLDLVSIDLVNGGCFLMDVWFLCGEIGPCADAALSSYSASNYIEGLVSWLYVEARR